MHVILATGREQFALVYLEDIIISFKSPLKYVQQVRQVLRLLSDPGVPLKIKKCLFFTESTA